jgi:hypothetical protein
MSDKRWIAKILYFLCEIQNKNDGRVNMKNNSLMTPLSLGDEDREEDNESQQETSTTGYFYFQLEGKSDRLELRLERRFSEVVLL